MTQNTPERKHDAALVSTGIMPVEVAKMLIVARRFLRKGPEVLQDDDTAVWAHILADAGIGADEVMPALLAYMKVSEWFPAPCQIIEHAEAIARERGRASRARQLEQAEALRRREEEAERERWELLTPQEQEAEKAARQAKTKALRSRFRHLVGKVMQAETPAPTPLEQMTPHEQAAAIAADTARREALRAQYADAKARVQ